MKNLNADHTVLIVGASHAGISMAEQLRKSGFNGMIDMIDREAEMPMERPPLSKAWLSEEGAGGEGSFLMRQPEWFVENNVNFHRGADAVAADPEQGTITLADGTVMSWDHLILATGATPRKLPVGQLPMEGGGTDSRMHVLRVPADAENLSHAMADAQSMVIIGGGYIGLEVAASAKKRGLDVTVIEMAPRLLARVASPEASAYFHQLHTDHGTTIRTATGVESISSSENGIILDLTSDLDSDQGGETLTADLVLAGIGVIPDMVLTEQLGLDTGNGILVDQHYATAREGIWAIGDVALPSGGYTDGAMRVESVHHAQMSAEIAAAAMTGNTPKDHEVPWFWSEQYDKKLQSAGLYTAGADVISRQGRREGSVSFWAFDGDDLISVEAIGDPQAFMIGKTVLSEDKPLTKEELADPEFELKAVLKR